MDMLQFSRRAARRGQCVAIVLGSHTTKAVVLQRVNGQFRLLNYVLAETPPLDPKSPPELLTEHLKNVFKALDARTNEVTLVVGMDDVLLRTVELPFYDPDRIRQAVKINSKNYVQHELADHEVDCYVQEKEAAEVTRPHLSTQAAGFGDGTAAVAATAEARATPKFRALVGAARKDTVNKLRAAASAAGLVVNRITFTQTSLANAAALVWPDVVQKEVVALVDLGFKTSTISILCGGQLGLTRVVGIGSDHITRSLAEHLGVNYAAADGVKLLMPEKVEPKLRKLLAALVQELRTAIDFFENQEVKTVTKIFVSGGAARSNFVMESLHDELGTRCERLNPVSALDLALPSLKAGEFEKNAPQLASAIGAAVTWSMPGAVRINLLAEEQEVAELRRRNPVRRGVWAAGVIGLTVLSCAGLVWLRAYVKQLELQGAINELQRFEKSVEQVFKLSRQAGLNERTVEALDQQMVNRSLWALSLNALQKISVPGVQVVRLSMSQTIVHPVAPPPRADGERRATAQPEPTVERLVLKLESKNYADPASVDRFIEAISTQPYFRTNLHKGNPVVLVNRLPPQVDPTNPERTFTLFTVECAYRDRILGYE